MSHQKYKFLIAIRKFMGDPCSQHVFSASIVRKYGSDDKDNGS